jgi:hypothetical protein
MWTLTADLVRDRYHPADAALDEFRRAADPDLAAPPV